MLAPGGLGAAAAAARFGQQPAAVPGRRPRGGWRGPARRFALLLVGALSACATGEPVVADLTVPPDLQGDGLGPADASPANGGAMEGAGADPGSAPGSRQQPQNPPPAADPADGSGAATGPVPDADVPTRTVTPRATTRGDGSVTFSAANTTSVVAFTTTLIVPAHPREQGTLFLWPGLQPSGANFQPIDNGVLQPVLTWGGSCAPGKQPQAYSSWWVSGQYVNTFGHHPNYTGCQGGDIMEVEPGDALVMDFTLQGSSWRQTVTDARTHQSVSFTIDMLGQAQNQIEFVIEQYDSAPVGDVVFTDTTFTLAAPNPEACTTLARGRRDAVGTIKVSDSGRRCAVDRIVLRAEGVAATDQAQPGP